MQLHVIGHDSHVAHWRVHVGPVSLNSSILAVARAMQPLMASPGVHALMINSLESKRLGVVDDPVRPGGVLSCLAPNVSDRGVYVVLCAVWGRAGAVPELHVVHAVLQ
jgi:hypothetical protein